MSNDIINDALERLEWHDSKEEQTPQLKHRAITRRAALTGAAAGTMGLAMASNALASVGTGGGSVFKNTKSYKFVVVNHVTTNPFFTPTQYGIQDASRLLGTSYQWTGSASSNVGQMVTAVQTAITAGANGIAVALIDNTAFNASVASAVSKGIPVVSYNADSTPANARLAYIGQDLLQSGIEMGQKILTLVPSGPVALFIATPGSANIQPRIDGAMQALKGSPVTGTSITTGAAVPQELTTIEAYWVGHSSTVKGLFAVDGGSTQSVAQTIQKYGLKGKIPGGGYDLTPITQTLLAGGYLDFTIDQQPYLQGFLPIIELFLYNVSKGLSGPADVDTGLKFLNSTTVKPYNSTKSRFEGTSSTAPVT